MTSTRTSPAEPARVLTARDVEVLRFVGRFDSVGVSHVVGRFKWGSSRAYRRLRQLAGAGYLTYHRPRRGGAGTRTGRAPGTYSITSAGLEAAGLDLGEPSAVSAARQRFVTAIAEVATLLELAGDRVLTARELATEREVLGSPPSVLDDAPLVVSGRGESRHAVEIETERELIRRSTRERLEAYAAAPDPPQRIRYFVGSPVVGEQVKAIASELGLARRVDVELLPG